MPSSSPQQANPPPPVVYASQQLEQQQPVVLQPLGHHHPQQPQQFHHFDDGTFGGPTDRQSQVRAKARTFLGQIDLWPEIWEILEDLGMNGIWPFCWDRLDFWAAFLAADVSRPLESLSGQG